MGNNPRVEVPYDLSPDHTVMLGVDFQQGFGEGASEHTRMPWRRSATSGRLRLDGGAPAAGSSQLPDEFKEFTDGLSTTSR